jgi:hypothetical protein
MIGEAGWLRPYGASQKNPISGWTLTIARTGNNDTRFMLDKILAFPDVVR